MIIVKITGLLIVITIILICAFNIWGENHQHYMRVGLYPWWAYIMAWLTILDAIGILISAIWLLFFYW